MRGDFIARELRLKDAEEVIKKVIEQYAGDPLAEEIGREIGKELFNISFEVIKDYITEEENYV